jgi:ribose 5-phosphate isomerase B
MKVFIATDHAGFDLKEKYKKFLEYKGYDVIDCGADMYDPNDDYPDFISKAAESVAAHPGSFGIVLGKSGAGECIVANKIKGIRAVLGVSETNVRLAREHNDANVLSIGSDLITQDQAEKFAELFLTTQFSNEERHKRRIEKIKLLEH